MKSLLFLFLLHPVLGFGQDTSAIERILQGKVPGIRVVNNPDKASPVSEVPLKSSSKEYLYNWLLDMTEVSANLDSEFIIIDSFRIEDYYFPQSLAHDSNHKIQILRTVVPKTGLNYLIGIQALPRRIPISMDTLFGRLILEYADKGRPVQYLSTNKLKKVNAAGGRGVIYDLAMSIPFKNKYGKCKVLAVENKKGNYIELYYFYNGIKNHKITKIINSQLGIVKFQ